jgi:hypothetical protein
MMPRSNFGSTWVPRIGEDAAAALRRYRWAGGTVPLTMIVLGVAATYAFEGGVLAKLLGAVLVLGAVSAFIFFLHSQRQFAAALSEWYGVNIGAGQLPLMNPTRFDAWCEKRGLRAAESADACNDSGTTPTAI